MNSSILKYLLIVVLISGAFNAVAQKILVLDKPGRVKRLRYFVGDKIQIITSDNSRISGEISVIGDSTITIEENKVVLSEISAVVKKRRFFSFTGTLLSTAGVFFGSIYLVNVAIDKDTKLDENAYVLGGVLVSGVVLSLFKEKKFKVKDKGRLKILDVTMVAPNDD